MDIVLVVYALCVFLLSPIWVIRSVKKNSQNRVKMVAIIVIDTFLVASAIYALSIVLK